MWRLIYKFPDYPYTVGMAFRHIAVLLLLSFLLPLTGYSWGFFAHQRINRLAVYILPPEMVGFYKKHIRYITENAVNPDRCRYAVAGEAPRHYIDLNVYGDSALYKMPRFWQQAMERYGKDTLMAHGIMPWHINRMKFQLTQAFKDRNLDQILRLSADIGHYIADASVPLHTTRNYNGQLTDQRGIHAFWESRLPEMLSDN
ncbi:zinc dependent phospholipase C family protein [Pontibacter sp. HSC-14F20]|uniref:zinc dependent phospholipase C family protein n=1 Tax=Pontibacter sp. HSC-14F20 TaxID=2864136 RepID=UPI00351CBC51